MLIHKNRKKKKETLYNFCQFVLHVKKKIEYRIKKQKQKHPIPEDKLYLTYIFPL